MSAFQQTLLFPVTIKQQFQLLLANSLRVQAQVPNGSWADLGVDKEDFKMEVTLQNWSEGFS